MLILRGIATVIHFPAIPIRKYCGVDFAVTFMNNNKYESFS